MQLSKIHPLARGIIIQERHILLVSNPSWKDDRFYLPGGHIENEESAIEAV